MRTILYAFIAIFIFGIIEPCLTNSVSAQNSILVQATDGRVSSTQLSQSAQIISDRLMDFTAEKFELKVIPDKNQILVVLKGNPDLKTVENLVTQKGAMAFYETYNRTTLAELLKEDNQLFSLLKNNNANRSDAKIGCTPVSEIAKVNAYLKNLGQFKNCKFVWDQHLDHSDACLYALKTDNEKGALIVGKEIESVQGKQDKATQINEIAIKLKQSAIPLWAEATKRNMNQAIAIVLDDQVLASPIIRSVIRGGNSSITGDFTLSQAKYIAAIGNHGELPLHFNVVK